MNYDDEDSEFSLISFDEENKEFGNEIVTELELTNTYGETENSGSGLDDAFFSAFGHPILKQDPIFRNEAITENVYWWNDYYWEPFKPNVLDGFLNNILLGMGVVQTCRKNDMKRGFLAHFSVPETEFNIDGKNLFCTKSGVIVLNKLKEVINGLGDNPSINEVLEKKAEWLKPNAMFMKNHITAMAPITIPDSVDEAKFKEDRKFFKDTFMRSLGYREDSFEWLMDLFSACLSGERKGDHFTTLYGAPGTGKTTITLFLEKVFGEQYVRTIEPEDVISKKNTSVRKFYRARFARIINISETSDKAVNASFIKKLTGKSKMLVGYDGETFDLDSHILIDSNHLIEPDEDDPSAFLRRYVVIPFGPKINECDQNKHLDEDLEAIKESFFLELLLRYSNVTVAELSTPAITKEVIETSELYKNPVKLFLDTWTVPAINTHGGTKIKVGELYRIFIQDFFYWYEAHFDQIFYRTEDFHRNLPEISRHAFTVKLECIYHNIVKGRGNELYLNNIIVHDPGTYNSMKQMQLERLKRLYLVAPDDNSAQRIIDAAEKPSVVSFPDEPDESGFSDILWYTGFPSFTKLGIPPSQEMWEDRVLLLIGNGQNLEFSNWLSKLIGIERTKELMERLHAALNMCSYNFVVCKNNAEIKGILGGMFDMYVKQVRSYTKPKVSLSPVKKVDSKNNTSKKVFLLGATPFSETINGIGGNINYSLPEIIEK